MVRDEAEGVLLDAGMRVTTTGGDAIGTLASVLVDEETEEAGFLIVSAGGIDRLVPFEAVDDVEEGTVLLDVERDTFDRLPRASMERDPTEAEIDLAYRVLGFEVETPE